METVYRHVARAVISYQDKILIARLKGAHSFLPGGGVETGESCEMALQRELFEELGLKSITASRFMGVMEDSYLENEKVIHSVSHVFEVNCPSSELENHYPHPQSKEDHLQFYWLAPTRENLENHNVLSRSVPELISNFMTEQKPFFFTDMQHLSRRKKV
ncbi:NUDIX domain-containing protein [Fictibacillus enclensis]|nr:NUDIX domain-containing protein [Fictibacillus enclensis]